MEVKSKLTELGQEARPRTVKGGVLNISIRKVR